MSKEYKISAFKATDYQDTYGNRWCEVAFEGESEPARWSMKPESVEKYQVGTVVFGHMEEATSKAGKPYNRFKVDQRPEGTAAPQSGSTASGSSWRESPEKQASVNRAVALKAAVNFLAPKDDSVVVDIVPLADALLLWLSPTSIDEDIKNVTDSLDGIDY